jgi:hypothetical protein
MNSEFPSYLIALKLVIAYCFYSPFALNETFKTTRDYYYYYYYFKVFENRVLRRIFGPRRDEVTGDWRILLNEELHNLYCSPNIIRMTKSSIMGGQGI